MSNDAKMTHFEEELRSLRNAYLSVLPEKVNLVHKAWHSLDFTEWDPAAYKSVYRLIHNLAGGAGTYGLHRVSQQARAILNIMKPWMDNAGPLETDPQLEINQAIELLEEVTASTIAETQQQTHHLRKPPVRAGITSQSTTSEIFLVEDDPDQATFLKLVLEQAGHRVQVFEDLNETKIALQALEPTAILMDMVFPEGEFAGAKTVSEIQQNRSIPIPIFFISTRTDLEARLSAVRAGAWHYFGKPVNVNKLVGLLNHYIKPTQLEKKRVLIVDDDPAVSSFFAAHLEEADNLEASLLSEPMKLLEALESQKPDLILMDYHMPECNGLELAAVIRQHENYTDLPIIFLTEEANIETKLTALNIGSDDFFLKSMGPERLVLAIQSRLSRLSTLQRQNLPKPWAMN